MRLSCRTQINGLCACCWLFWLHCTAEFHTCPVTFGPFNEAQVWSCTLHPSLAPPAVRLTPSPWAHNHVHRWQYIWGCVQLGGSEPLPCQRWWGRGQGERDLPAVLWGDISIGAGSLRGQTHSLPYDRRHCGEETCGHRTSMQQHQVRLLRTRAVWLICD